MRAIYILNFEMYHSAIQGCLVFSRVGKTPIVKVTRQFGDLPFFQYFKMMLFGKISRWFGVRENGIEYCIKVSHGMEEDVVWNQREDGMYEPCDSVFDISMPYLARKTPPTNKIIKKGFVVDTKKPSRTIELPVSTDCA